MRLAPPTAVVALTVLATPVAASAATRYAAPTGTPSADCPITAPCPLADAVTGAAPGDVVKVSRGTYNVASTITATVPLTIEGRSRVASGRPVIVGAEEGVSPLQSSARLVARWLMIRANGDGTTALAATGAGSVFDHLVMTAVGRGTTALRTSGQFQMRESVAYANGVAIAGLVVQGTASGHAELRNDTIVAEGIVPNGIAVYADEGANIDVQATNVIAFARPNLDASAGAAAGGSASIAFDHSNVATTEGQVTSTNGQTDPPQLTGDLHETYGSPTIDAGLDDPANGATDLDGSPRRATPITCGSTHPGPTRTDIGAYEFFPPPPPCPPPPTPVVSIDSITTANHSATIDFTVRAFDARLRAQCSLDGSPWKYCKSPKTYRRLARGSHTFGLGGLWHHGEFLNETEQDFVISGRHPAR